MVDETFGYPDTLVQTQAVPQPGNRGGTLVQTQAVPQPGNKGGHIPSRPKPCPSQGMRFHHLRVTLRQVATGQPQARTSASPMVDETFGYPDTLVQTQAVPQPGNKGVGTFLQDPSRAPARECVFII
jgi:hypothetical protein